MNNEIKVDAIGQENIAELLKNESQGFCFYTEERNGYIIEMLIKELKSSIYSTEQLTREKTEQKPCSKLFIRKYYTPKKRKDLSFRQVFSFFHCESNGNHQYRLYSLFQ